MLMEQVELSHLRVRYAETDQMGFAHHGAYLPWFEVGRTDYLRSRGLPYRRLEEAGIFLPVVEASVRYLAPARYDDALVIATRPVSWSPARLELAYEVRDAGGRVIARGRTVHAFMDGRGRAMNLKKRHPDFWAALERALGPAPGRSPAERPASGAL